MPNWCSNQVTITGPKPVIDEIKAICNSGEGNLLNWLVPRPSDQEENWYEWNVSNWGTKWDISDITVTDDAEDDSISISFDTAWSPPLEAFRTWAQGDGRVTYRLEYWEGGMGFVGWDSYDGEYFDEEYIDAENDQTGYRDMVAESWGYDDWEDTEPLTEWYTQGVEEKGLDK